MINCPVCGKELSDWAQRCDGCGARGLGDNEVHHELTITSGSIGNCGKSITPKITQRLDKLAEASLKSFLDKYNEEIAIYPLQKEDCFWELTMDLFDLEGTPKLLTNWVNSLDKMHNNAFNQGAKYALNTFKKYVQDIAELEPKEEPN